MPPELLATILQFNPNSVRVLPVVSRYLKQNTALFFRWNMHGILLWSSSSNSGLANFLNRNFTNIDFGSPSNVIRQFHFLLPKIIRALSPTPINSPSSRILLANELHSFNSHIEDVNLQRSWNNIREAIMIANPTMIPNPELAGMPENRIRGAMRAHPVMIPNPLLAGMPEQDAPVLGIRSWMREEANQPALQGITQLNLGFLYLDDPTFLPEEIALCGGLQRLELQRNSLVSLQENAFLRMTALQRLDLSNNRLTLLPERGFQELVSLQYLNLSFNYTDPLPEGIFQGLTALQELYIFCNQLTLLPKGIFHDLGNLQQLSLGYNSLTSLPGEIFQGLTALQQLSLCDNRLASLPERVFLELTNLQELELHGNPQSLIFFKNLERRGLKPNNLGDLGTMRDFFNYTCISSLAVLYQLAAGDRPLEDVQTAFSRLPPATKEALFGKVWEEAGSPRTDDPNWGEHHTFDDMPCFQRALKRYVSESFERLGPDQRNGVYGHVYHLAQSQRVPIDPNVHNWREVHAFDNILRLIDAMERQKQSS
jgi:Leucine-rich repeat (LRR) protein